MADPGGTFTDNFVSMADNFGLWLTNPLQLDPFVSFSDDAAAVAVTTPKAPGEIAAGVGQAVDDATKHAADAAMVVLAWGGVIVLGALVLRNQVRG